MKYSKKVLEHFTHPHNQGRIRNADGVATVGNPVCGDIMKIYIKIGENKKGEKILEDIKFETLGCGAAVATSSMVTDLAKGETIEKALKISRQDVSKELQGLPPTKEHCSNLAAIALHDAVKNYKDKLKKKK
ncbi:MAG TPA: iron-sulfur cluster assembly scaffold protein [Candidatus Moranbacteria bacterium]|nr:iron-sulfur cluster assembly scaffold protein [Candidatus Moranbacteria bacterium]